MPDRFSLLQLMPFLLTTSNMLPNPKRLNMIRIIEAIIIAALSGIMAAGATTYITTQVLKVELSHLSKKIEDHEQRENVTFTRIYGELKGNRDLIEDHMLEQMRSTRRTQTLIREN